MTTATPRVRRPLAVLVALLVLGPLALLEPAADAAAAPAPVPSAEPADPPPDEDPGEDPGSTPAAPEDPPASEDAPAPAPEVPAADGPDGPRQEAPAVATAEPLVRLVVDSPAFGGRDASPGDGVCATAEGACTLRAALEESNALNRGPGEVLITVADGLVGNIEPDGSNTQAASNRSSWMFPTATNVAAAGRVSTFDVGGAFYHVTAPVTIDLDDRLSVNDGTYDTSQGAAFFVNAADVTFRNVSQIFGSGSSFVMGPLAKNVLIQGGETRTRASNAPDRFLVFRSGSQDITLRDYAVSGFRHHATGSTVNSSRSGLLWFDSAANTTFARYTVDNVLFDYPTSGGCTATDGTGCATSLIDFRTRNASSNIRVQNFTFTNSVVQNMPSARGLFAFPFSDGETPGSNDGITSYAVQLTDLRITDNQFLHNRRFNSPNRDPKKYGAFIVLPVTPMQGTNLIARNLFVRADPGLAAGDVDGLNPYAIYHRGNRTAANNTHQANAAIVDNHFEGYMGISPVRLYHSGQLTVARNTFGSLNSSNPRGATNAVAEETAATLGMVINAHNRSNREIRTWYPTAAPVARTEGACTAEVAVHAVTGTGNQVPQVPVYLDLYWTADRTAEVYLGRFGPFGSQTDQVLRAPLPEAGDPALVHVAHQQAPLIPVDPESGAVHGYVRVQTHSAAARGGSAADGDLESSQFSRVTALTGTCGPGLAPPVLDPSDGTAVSGTVAPGLAVDLSLADTGAALATLTTSEASGAFRYVPEQRLANGTVVAAVARDEHGNVSPPATVTVLYGPSVQLLVHPRVRLVDRLPAP